MMLGKRTEDFMTGKRNISRPFRNVISTLPSAIGDHFKTTGHNLKWDHFDVLSSGKTHYHCKVEETLFIQELQPALSVNASSEQLLLY